MNLGFKKNPKDYIFIIKSVVIEILNNKCVTAPFQIYKIQLERTFSSYKVIEFDVDYGWSLCSLLLQPIFQSNFRWLYSKQGRGSPGIRK